MSKQLATPKNTSTSRRYRGRRTSASRRNAVTHHELSGGSIQVPSNPPSITYQPWNHLTVVYTGNTSTTGEITVKVSDLCDQIKAQIDPISTGLSSTPIFNVKLQRIRAWNLTGHMIALSVDDYSDAAKAISDVDALCGLVDTGSSSHTPAVGYDLPSSHRNIVMRNGSSSATDKKAVLYHVMAPASDTVIIYTTILWKFDGPSKFSTFNRAMLAAIESIAENVKGTNADVGAIRKMVDDMDSRSTRLAWGNAIVDGALKAAPYVIPAVARDDSLSKLKSLLSELKEVPDMSVKEWIEQATHSSYDVLDPDIDEGCSGVSQP